MSRYWDMSDCGVCSSILREQRFKAEKEDRPFCVICRRTIDQLKRSRISLDVNELTYQRVDFWLSSDLCPLCRECHSFIEKMKPKPNSHCDNFAIVAACAAGYPLMTQLLEQSCYLEEFQRDTGFEVTAYQAFWVIVKDMTFDRAREKGGYDFFYHQLETEYADACKLDLQSIRTPEMPQIPSDAWSKPCLSSSKTN